MYSIRWASIQSPVNPTYAATQQDAQFSAPRPMRTGAKNRPRGCDKTQEIGAVGSRRRRRWQLAERLFQDLANADQGILVRGGIGGIGVFRILPHAQEGMLGTGIDLVLEMIVRRVHECLAVRAIQQQGIGVRGVPFPVKGSALPTMA